MALSWGESRVDYLQHGNTCMSYFWIRVWNVSKTSKRLALFFFLWMEVCILMWNKTGIQNGFCKQQSLEAWGYLQREVCAWEGGIREWLYLWLHQTSLRVQYRHKICLVVVPLNRKGQVKGSIQVSANFNLSFLQVASNQVTHCMVCHYQLDNSLITWSLILSN